MKLYAVRPDRLDTEPEGEDMREWFTNERAAMRFARACIREMEVYPGGNLGSWLTGRVTVTLYVTSHPLTVTWVARAMSNTLSTDVWHRIEQIAELQPRAVVHAGRASKWQ